MNITTMAEDLDVLIYAEDESLIPIYKTEGASGADLKANIDTDILVIEPRTRALIPTGVSIKLPVGFEAQIRPRSGLALKEGITVLNTPGTIDNDYISEIKVILFNTSDKPVSIQKNQRIAQMVISDYIVANFKRVVFSYDLGASVRSEGFGETGDH